MQLIHVVVEGRQVRPTSPMIIARSNGAIMPRRSFWEEERMKEEKNNKGLRLVSKFGEEETMRTKHHGRG